MFFHQAVCSVLTDLSRRLEILFVSYKEDHDILFAQLEHIPKPMLKTCESCAIGDRVAQKYDVCGPIEDLCHRAESFLTCRVPDLQLHFVVLNFDTKGAKLHTNGNIVICVKSILSETVQDA